LAATERHGRSLLAFTALRTGGAECIRGDAANPRTEDVTSGFAVLNRPTPSTGSKAGSAGRGLRLFHRLRAECAKSHRFAPHHGFGDSTAAFAAVVTYEAPGRQR